MKYTACFTGHGFGSVFCFILRSYICVVDLGKLLAFYIQNIRDRPASPHLILTRVLIKDHGIRSSDFSVFVTGTNNNRGGVNDP